MMQKRWDGFVPASCAKDKNGADFDSEMEQVGWRDDGGSARTGHERRGSEVTEAGKKLLDAMVSCQEGRAVAKRMDDWQESGRLLWMTSNFSLLRSICSLYFLYSFFCKYCMRLSLP